MKKAAKNIIAAILGWQVRRLLAANKVTVVGVVGSIGKTSTKFAIARVVGAERKVIFQEGNYNDIVSVPLIFFGHSMPGVVNIIAWLSIILKNERILKKPYPYEVAVVELGTDGPGQIHAFKRYLNLEWAIVAAITPEHMEYFADLDKVAQEELAVAGFSSKLLINSDLCDEKYLSQLTPKPVTYGIKKDSDYKVNNLQFADSSAKFTVKGPEINLDLNMKAVSSAEIYSATAAAVIAHNLGIDKVTIAEAVASLEPVAGRMQRLKGIKDSLIIDETYNASPVAVKAALDSLYAMDAPQKIAILGNMNELGDTSQESHKEVGRYCEPKQLDLVVTIGPHAKEYLAHEAKNAGCTVASFDNPYEAGEFVRNRLKAGAIILAKGSQNKVFAEEAVKLLLRDAKDEKLLVRQSDDWLKKKAKNFSG